MRRTVRSKRAQDMPARSSSHMVSTSLVAGPMVTMTVVRCVYVMCSRAHVPLLLATRGRRGSSSSSRHRRSLLCNACVLVFCRLRGPTSAMMGVKNVLGMSLCGLGCLELGGAEQASARNRCATAVYQAVQTYARVCNSLVTG